jgi:Tol biopolymer transport system component
MNTISTSNLARLGRELPRDPCALLAACLMSLALAACSSSSGDFTAPAEPGDGAGGGSGAGSGGNSPGGGSGGPGGSAPSEGLKPVVYVADQDVYGMFELYVTSPTDPGASIKLNPPLPPGGNIDVFAVTPSGESVVYVADQEIDNRYELFIVDFDAPGAATKLSAPLGADRDVKEFVIGPHSGMVIYRADHDTHNVWELFVVEVENPGTATKVNAPLTDGGWVRDGFLVSPDGSKLVYRADQDQKDTTELYIADLAVPGVSYRVNPELVEGGNVYPHFKLTADGAYVGYIADQDTDGQLELYAVDVNIPGVSMKLSGPMIAEGDVCNFAFSPDSAKVAYCADQESDGLIELYMAALNAPGASVKLNPPLIAGGHVTHRYTFGPDADFVVYAAHQDSPTRADLYRADLDAPGVATKLNDTLVAGGNVEHFALSPDGTRVAYMANQGDPAVVEIYEVRLAAPGESIRVSGPTTDLGVYTFVYEDDRHIVYTSIEASETDELYRVDRTAPGVSTRLNGPLVSGGEVADFALVP